MSQLPNKNRVRNSDISALAVSFREYIARHKAEEERDQLIQDLTTRNQDLSQFAYITSHNLRAPLSNLIGLIDILNYDLLDEYNKTIIDMFRDSAQKLNETIFDLNQMLNFRTSPRSGIEKVNIVRIFKKVCNSFNKEILSSGIKIHTDFKAETIPFNKSYLESILMNLMSNAIKYAAPGRTLQVDVATMPDSGGNIILTFRDNGMGIDLLKHKDRIFGLNERFHDHVDGSGIGLFITKTQINSLGGEITVESEVDKGSTFVIKIKNKL